MAMMVATGKAGLEWPRQPQLMIRAKLYRPFRDGEAHPKSFFRDEKAKSEAPPCCVYCAATAPLRLGLV